MTITIKKEVELREFEAWSGGKEWLETIKKHEKSDEILALLTDIINDNEEAMTDTQVNDLLWFDSYDIILEFLDIDLCE